MKMKTKTVDCLVLFYSLIAGDSVAKWLMRLALKTTRRSPLWLGFGDWLRHEDML